MAVGGRLAFILASVCSRFSKAPPLVCHWMEGFLPQGSEFDLNARLLKEALTRIPLCTVACQAKRFLGERRPGLSGTLPGMQRADGRGARTSVPGASGGAMFAPTRSHTNVVKQPSFTRTFCAPSPCNIHSLNLKKI